MKDLRFGALSGDKIWDCDQATLKMPINAVPYLDPQLRMALEVSAMDGEPPPPRASTSATSRASAPAFCLCRRAGGGVSFVDVFPVLTHTVLAKHSPQAILPFGTP